MVHIWSHFVTKISRENFSLASRLLPIVDVKEKMADVSVSEFVCVVDGLQMVLPSFGSESASCLRMKSCTSRFRPTPSAAVINLHKGQPDPFKDFKEPYWNPESRPAPFLHEMFTTFYIYLGFN